MDPDLYGTPGDRLDAFLEHSLQPQRDWKEDVEDAKQRIEKFLRNQCFRDQLIQDREVRVLKVMKGGSWGKGTTLNQTSDVDIIVFLSCFSSFQEQANLRGTIIDFIEERVDHCSESLAYNITVVHHRPGSRTPRSLTLQVQSRKSSEVIRVDVVLAFDALGNFCLDYKPEPEIYEDLINSFSHPGEFAPSFTVLQRDFIKKCPVKVKNLLRLVKFWYLKYVKSQNQGVPLPSKYALELLTIYAWEVGTGQQENFEMDEGFAAVMTLLRDYEDICIYWTKYYDFQRETVRNFIKQQLKGSRPIILDPSDPTNNLGKKRRWDLVAKEAAYCLCQPCCLTVDPKEGWHVQKARDVQVTVKQTGKEDWTLSVDPYRPIWKMKGEIKIRNGIWGKQRLSFQEPEGDRQLLSSQKTLAYYGIFSKVNIRVLETFATEIQVFVKDSSGQSRPYAIDPEDTIRDLKEIIEEAGGPRVEDQILEFEGRRLRDRKCLEDLQIEDCDTITLIRR